MKRHSSRFASFIAAPSASFAAGEVGHPQETESRPEDPWLIAESGAVGDSDPFVRGDRTEAIHGGAVEGGGRQPHATKCTPVRFEPNPRGCGWRGPNPPSAAAPPTGRTRRSGTIQSRRSNTLNFRVSSIGEQQIMVNLAVTSCWRSSGPRVIAHPSRNPALDGNSEATETTFLLGRWRCALLEHHVPVGTEGTGVMRRPFRHY
jgi:hypothetical protein